MSIADEVVAKLANVTVYHINTVEPAYWRCDEATQAIRAAMAPVEARSRELAEALRTASFCYPAIRDRYEALLAAYDKGE